MSHTHLLKGFLTVTSHICLSPMFLFAFFETMTRETSIAPTVFSAMKQHAHSWFYAQTHWACTRTALRYLHRWMLAVGSLTEKLLSVTSIAFCSKRPLVAFILPHSNQRTTLEMYIMFFLDGSTEFGLMRVPITKILYQ